MSEQQNESWHLDKKVPLGIILALAVQTVTIVAIASDWRATTNSRLSSLEESMADNVLLRRKQWDSIKDNTARYQSLDAKLSGLDERTKSIATQTEQILRILLEKSRRDNQ